MHIKLIIVQLFYFWAYSGAEASKWIFLIIIGNQVFFISWTDYFFVSHFSVAAILVYTLSFPQFSMNFAFTIFKLGHLKIQITDNRIYFKMSILSMWLGFMHGLLGQIKLLCLYFLRILFHFNRHQVFLYRKAIKLFLIWLQIYFLNWRWDHIVVVWSAEIRLIVHYILELFQRCHSSSNIQSILNIFNRRTEIILG